jgi:L-lactate dehydrogenase complex protein LldG
MPREEMLTRIRAALGRSPAQTPAPPEPPRLRVPPRDLARETERFIQNFEVLGGRAIRVKNPAEASRAVADLLAGRTAVISNAPYLKECGILPAPGAREDLRAECARCDFGITGADAVLSDTGTIALLSSNEEARLISLLPPAHIAVFAQSKILSGLDELLTLIPRPADRTSALVLITGPSRTADIEQILVRGVHGPGEIFAVIVEE